MASRICIRCGKKTEMTHHEDIYDICWSCDHEYDDEKKAEDNK